MNKGNKVIFLEKRYGEQTVTFEITEIIIKAFYNVYNELGYGFLEKVYENAMLIELKALGLDCFNQQGITVHYKGNEVGYFIADINVAEKSLLS